MNCEHCGMHVYEGPLLTHDQLYGRELVAGNEPLAKDEHVCPEPYHLETARFLVSLHAATGIPMHPETYARCVLAYKLAGMTP